MLKYVCLRSSPQDLMRLAISFVFAAALCAQTHPDPVLERMVPPLEHMLRNAVVHAIEPTERRTALGKPDVGRISISFERDGAEVVIVVADDGAGINVKLIREKAVALGLTRSEERRVGKEC